MTPVTRSDNGHRMFVVRSFKWQRTCSFEAIAILLLLAVETVLFLAERYRFWFGQWKGYAVLLGCAAVAGALLSLVLWLALCLLLRLRFQFRLSSLILFVTCSALPFSWLASDMRQAARQRDAVAGLSQFSQIKYDFELLVRTATSSARPPGPAWLRGFFGQDFFADVAEATCWTDKDLEHCRTFEHLRTLVCESSREITDNGLIAIESFPELEGLQLGSVGMGRMVYRGPLSLTEAGFRHVAGHKRLRLLGVSTDRFSDASLEDLQGLGNLETLSLRAGNISDRGLELIPRQFPKLRFLDICATKTTDAGIAHLVGLPFMEQLDLTETAVTDKGVRCVARLANLRVLCLSQTKISDEGLREVAALGRLESLSLDFDPAITDKGLMELARLHSLTYLSTGIGDNVTDSGVAQLQRASWL